jgi:ribosomal protein S18 acetylase RimI-like enzyme
MSEYQLSVISYQLSGSKNPSCLENILVLSFKFFSFAIFAFLLSTLLMFLPDGYQLQIGSRKDRALLIEFMNLAYQELFPDRQEFSHLSLTVEQYLSVDTPLWWVKSLSETSDAKFIACLWMGNAIDQVSGDRYAHIFLIYVALEHRRRGLAKALMHQAQSWATSRGDRQISLQVFPHNQIALDFYHRLGFAIQSYSMLKSL